MKVSYDDLRDEALELLENDEVLFNDMCEELDSWDGFLGDSRRMEMEMIDEFFSSPSEALSKIDFDDFNYNHDYFYFDNWGNICSSDDKDYSDDHTAEEVLDAVIDNACHIFISDADARFKELVEALDNAYDYYDDETLEEVEEDDEDEDEE